MGGDVLDTLYIKTLLIISFKYVVVENVISNITVKCNCQEFRYCLIEIVICDNS